MFNFMMSYVVRLALLCCCLSGCHSNPVTAPKQQHALLASEQIKNISFDGTSRELFTCKASVAQNIFAIGDPVVVKVSLHNRLGTSVSIRDYPWHYPFFTFDVRDPGGRILPLTQQFQSPGIALHDEWKSLPAGETYTIEIDLGRWYDMSKPGTYEITARWCLYAKQAPYERVAKPIRIEMRNDERQRGIAPALPADADKPQR